MINIVANLPLESTTSDVLFSRCSPFAFTPNANIGKLVHTSERETIFSANCSKFAVECSRSIKISKNVRNLGLSEKIDGFLDKVEFSESLKVENLLYFVYRTVFFLKNVFFAQIMRFYKVGKL